MPDVRYQFRNIGLNLPPDLGAWLDAYVQNRMPIALEEWKLKVKEAIAKGKVDPDEYDALIGVIKEGQRGTVDIAGREANLAGIETQSAAKVSSALTAADASKFAARARMQVANAQEMGKNLRLDRKFEQDLLASLQITPTESDDINATTQKAQSIFDNTAGTYEEKIRNSAKLTADAVLASGAKVGDKNTIHGLRYVDEAAQRYIAAMNPTPEQKPALMAAVQEFFYNNAGVPSRVGTDGIPSAVDVYRESPEFAPIIDRAHDKQFMAGVADRGIPDLTMYEGAPPAAARDAVPAEPQAPSAPADGQPSARVGADSATATTGAQGTARPVPPATNLQPAEYPPATAAPGNLAIPEGMYTAQYGTGVGRAATVYTQSQAEWAKQQLAEKQKAAAAYRSEHGAEIPAFRLAPTPGRHPEQDRVDALRKRLDEIRTKEPDRWMQIQETVGNMKRAKVSDAAIKRDTALTAADKAAADPESPEWSRGPVDDDNPMSKAASAAREASQEWARLQTSIREQGMTGKPEAQESVRRFLERQATVLASLSGTARAAYGKNLTIDDGAYKALNTMVETRVQAKKASEAARVNMVQFPDAESEASYDEAMKSYAPNKQADSAYKTAYEAAKMSGGPEGVQQAIDLAKSDIKFGGDDMAFQLQKLWDADEDPTMRLATGQAEKALNIRPTNKTGVPPATGMAPAATPTFDGGVASGQPNIAPPRPPPPTGLAGAPEVQPPSVAVHAMEYPDESDPRFQALIKAYKAGPRPAGMSDEDFDSEARAFALSKTAKPKGE